MRGPGSWLSSSMAPSLVSPPPEDSENSRQRFECLERQRQWLLEQLLYAREELRAVRPVQDAVIADEAERHLIARDDAPGIVDRRPLLELADRQDRGLRRIDDRREELDPE